MQKLASFMTVASFLVSAVGASSIRDGNKNFLHLILSRTERTRGISDDLSIPEARSKRGFSKIIITDEPDPITIVATIDCEIIVDQPDPLHRVQMQGRINGKLVESVRSSAKLEEITDGSDLFEIEGMVAGKVRLGNDASVPGIIEAKAGLAIWKKTVNDFPQLIFITGRLRGTLETDTRERDLSAITGIITDDTGMMAIKGRMTNVILSRVMEREVGLNDPDE